MACEYGWVDVESAAPVLQRPPRETEMSLDRLRRAHVDDEALITTVVGVPGEAPPAYRLGDAMRARLAERMRHLVGPGGRKRMILSWAHARGRVSSTEVADLAGLSIVRAGQVLTDLESDGTLAPGREVKRGRGFFYTPTDAHPPSV